MVQYEHRDPGCCCCKLETGIKVIGVFTFFSMLGALDRAMNCDPRFAECGTNVYWETFFSVWFFTPFIIVAGSAANETSRKLLMRFWAIGYTLIVLGVTLTAALWIPTGMTKDICMNQTTRLTWSCDLEAYEYWPGKEDYKPEDMENFSIAADGTTA